MYARVLETPVSDMNWGKWKREQEQEQEIEATVFLGASTHYLWPTRKRKCQANMPGSEHKRCLIYN